MTKNYNPHEPLFHFFWLPLKTVLFFFWWNICSLSNISSSLQKLMNIEFTICNLEYKSLKIKSVSKLVQYTYVYPKIKYHPYIYRSFFLFSSRSRKCTTKMHDSARLVKKLARYNPAIQAGWLAPLGFRDVWMHDGKRKGKELRVTDGHPTYLYKYIHIPSLLCCEEHNIHWLSLSRQKTHSSALRYTAKISFHLGFCLQPNRLSKRKAQVLSFHFDL